MRFPPFLSGPSTAARRFVSRPPPRLTIEVPNGERRSEPSGCPNRQWEQRLVWQLAASSTARTTRYIPCYVIDGVPSQVTNSVGITLSGRTTMEATAAKPVAYSRLISLLVALMGCVVVAIPAIFPLTEPAPLLLVGSGVTVVALGGFLFFSL